MSKNNDTTIDRAVDDTDYDYEKEAMKEWRERRTDWEMDLHFTRNPRDPYDF